MISRFVRAGLVLALSLAPAVPAAVPKKPAAKPVPARHDWLRTASRTAEGAIVIGNPAARVKLVEYLSMTCPHCAEMSAEVMPPLRRDYIATGLVSLEVRHAVRDGYDYVSSLLLRCQPVGQYLPSIEGLYATQLDWMTKGANAKNLPGFDGMSEDQKMAAAARAAGFDIFFAKHGLPPKAYAACLADEKAKLQLAEMAGNSWERDAIPGTPLMLINGKREEGVHSWAALEPLIKAALK